MWIGSAYDAASQDISPKVNWLIFGIKLPGRLDGPALLPTGQAFDLRLWLSEAVGLDELFWLAVYYSGTLLIRNSTPPLGPPQGPRHSPTVWS